MMKTYWQVDSSPFSLSSWRFFQSIRHVGLMNVFAIMMSIFQVTRWFALIGIIPMVRLVGVFAWILVVWHGFLRFWIWHGFFDLRTLVLSTLGWDPSGFHGQTSWCDFEWKPFISLYSLIFFFFAQPATCAKSLLLSWLQAAYMLRISQRDCGFRPCLVGRNLAGSVS